jgi:hypothetical protein
MNEKIVASVVFPIDVDCQKCGCKKTVTASGAVGDPASYHVRDEKPCECEHAWPDHRYVRDAKSNAQKKRDGEI